MWTYQQQTGILRHNGAAVGTGYSGLDTPDVLGKNNPAAQEIHGVGPVPVGKYSIGAFYHDPVDGPVTMRLTPDPANQMYGRSGFKIHADSFQHPGRASLGCIVLHCAIRELVASSGDTALEVVA